VRFLRGLGILLVALTVGLSAHQALPASAAVRHHFYVGTITAISANMLVIHSKTHATNYRFVVNSQTKFLRKGVAASRGMFKVGSYVTVSYSPGPNNSLIAWHVSLRK
jgi:Domain of unknown function (DUF5666)